MRDAALAATAGDEPHAALEREVGRLRRVNEAQTLELRTCETREARMRDEAATLRAELEESGAWVRELTQEREAALAEAAAASEAREHDRWMIAQLKEELLAAKGEVDSLREAMADLEAELGTASLDLKAERTSAQVRAAAYKLKAKVQEKKRCASPMGEKTAALQLRAAFLKAKHEEGKKVQERLAGDLQAKEQQLEKAAARAAQEQAAIKLTLETQLAHEKEKRGCRKYEYESPIISRLERANLLYPAPPEAKDVEAPEALLASLDIDLGELKASLPYSIVCVGAHRSGKSSLHVCLAKGAPDWFRKRLPDIVSPTTAFSLTPTVHREPVRRGSALGGQSSGAGKRVGLGRAGGRTTATHVKVWDTPCDESFLANLPAGTLPGRGACYVVAFMLHQKFSPQTAAIIRVLDAVAGNVQEGATPMPLMLVGTRKDLLAPPRDASALAEARLQEAARWWRKVSAPWAGRFALVGCYAASCKDWCIQPLGAEPGQAKQGFPHVLAKAVKALCEAYPMAPPALLGEPDYFGGGAADPAEWWLIMEGVDIPSDTVAARKATYRAVVSVLLHLHRLRERGVWLLGRCGLLDVLHDHIPSHVKAARPNFPTELADALEAWGVVSTLGDPAYPDNPREAVAVLRQEAVANASAALLLPAVYMSLGDVYGPARLAEVLRKHAGFNVAELAPCEWEAAFHGKFAPHTATALLRAATAFRKDPLLGRECLPLLALVAPSAKGPPFAGARRQPTNPTPLANRLALPVKAVAADADVFIPGAALCALSLDVQGVFAALFAQFADGALPGASEARLPRAVTACELATIFSRIAALDPAYLRFWRDGAAVAVDGLWAYVAFSQHTATVCYDPTAAALRDALCGMVADVVPCRFGAAVPPPPAVRVLPRAPTLAACIDALPPDALRGTRYPEHLIPQRQPPTLVVKEY